MDLDFPVNPPVGETYTGVNGHEWMWDGIKWVALGAGDGVIGGAFLPLVGGTMQGPLNIQSTGAPTIRSVQDRWAEMLSLHDFDATNGADYSPALTAAIAALSSGTGGKIVLPAGMLPCSSAIIADIPAGMTITIEGMGQNASTLYFTNATDGLRFMLQNSGTLWGSVRLEGFSIVRGPASPAIANIGLNIFTDPAVATLYAGTSQLRDLTVWGSSPKANQWNTAVVLSGVSGTVVDNLSTEGIDAITTDRGDVALSLGGSASNQYATSYMVSNCVLIGYSVGINLGSRIQGAFITNSTIIGQYDSVRLISTAAALTEDVGLTNSTLNGAHRGVYISHGNQCRVTGNTILRFGSGVDGFAGIEINQSGYCSIADNNVIGTESGNQNGIIVSDCGTLPNTITGNVATNLTPGVSSGIWLKGTTVAAVAAGNNSETGAWCVFQDNPGNVAVGNMYQGAPDTILPGLRLSNGTLAAPPLAFGAADGTGISRSGAALLFGVTNSLSLGLFPSGGQFYGPLAMLNSRITQLADATAATDALNLRVGDARYAPVTAIRAAAAVSVLSSNVGPITTAAYVNLAPISYTVPRGGNSRIMVNVNLDCSTPGDSQIVIAAARLDVFPGTVRQAFLYQADGSSGGISTQFVCDVTGPTILPMNLQVARTGGATTGYTVLAGSQITVVDLGPSS